MSDKPMNLDHLVEKLLTSAEMNQYNPISLITEPPITLLEAKSMIRSIGSPGPISPITSKDLNEKADKIMDTEEFRQLYDSLRECGYEPNPDRQEFLKTALAYSVIIYGFNKRKMERYDGFLFKELGEENGYFFNHPYRVAKNLIKRFNDKEMPVDEVTVASSFLHDVVEEIASRDSLQIENIVENVMKRSNRSIDKTMLHLTKEAVEDAFIEKATELIQDALHDRLLGLDMGAGGYSKEIVQTTNIVNCLSKLSGEHYLEYFDGILTPTRDEVFRDPRALLVKLEDRDDNTKTMQRPGHRFATQKKLREFFKNLYIQEKTKGFLRGRKGSIIDVIRDSYGHIENAYTIDPRSLAITAKGKGTSCLNYLNELRDKLDASGLVGTTYEQILGELEYALSKRMSNNQRKQLNSSLKALYHYMSSTNFSKITTEEDVSPQQYGMWRSRFGPRIARYMRHHDGSLVKLYNAIRKPRPAEGNIPNDPEYNITNLVILANVMHRFQKNPEVTSDIEGFDSFNMRKKGDYVIEVRSNGRI